MYVCTKNMDCQSIEFIAQLNYTAHSYTARHAYAHTPLARENNVPEISAQPYGTHKFNLINLFYIDYFITVNILFCIAWRLIFMLLYNCSIPFEFKRNSNQIFVLLIHFVARHRYYATVNFVNIILLPSLLFDFRLYWSILLHLSHFWTAAHPG